MKRVAEVGHVVEAPANVLQSIAELEQLPEGVIDGLRHDDRAGEERVDRSLADCDATRAAKGDLSCFSHLDEDLTSIRPGARALDEPKLLERGRHATNGRRGDAE